MFNISPELLNMWAVDPNQSFSSMFHTRNMGRMPQFYQDSEFLKRFFKAIGPEFDIFSVLLEFYHVREIVRVINNEEGWGFEKLVGQRFVTTANRYLSKWADLLEITEDPNSYIKTKERLKVILERKVTNTPSDLKDMISILSDVPRSNVAITENFAAYSVIVAIKFNEDTGLEAFIEDKVRDTMPAHLSITVSFFVCSLDDAVPCELGDANAILLGGQ